MYKILIVVDMQNDFIDGALGTAEAVAIVPRAVHRINESRGELILFTQDTHCEDYLNTPEGRKLPVIHCVKGSRGWQIRAEIWEAWQNNPDTVRLGAPAGNIFEKPVFGSVALVDFLKSKEREIEEIEILGLCTDICVISNAIMIKNALPNVKIAVNAEACAATTQISHQEALNIMEICQIDII
ncbi:MAG: cysteine hydrolase [Clostridiales bacterium]|jgi:nicotinamidase-related amidase|nr:cysteine hydrolase [Clostridiales bacterium]